ncbi:hypothetical protein [Acinetobacter pragensis]|uniref:hypothetical protein n=1 Tax=Acinetobacter pragensis TaxID=1806892 RepID=UPI0033426591
MQLESSTASINPIWTQKNFALSAIIILCFALALYARTLPIADVGLDIVLSVIVAILISVVMTSTGVLELGQF